MHWTASDAQRAQRCLLLMRTTAPHDHRIYALASSPLVFAFFFFGARRGCESSVWRASSWSDFSEAIEALQSARTAGALTKGTRQAWGRARAGQQGAARLGSAGFQGVLTCKEEFGDQGARSRLHNVVWAEKTWGQRGECKQHSPCAAASCTPMRARFSSSSARSVNGNAPAFFWISEKTAREVFILS